MDHFTRADLEETLSHSLDRVFFKLALGAAQDAEEARGRVKVILIILDDRQIRLTDQQLGLLERTTDLETLRGWLLAAVHATSAEDVFR
jgi:hypothetical protein